MFRFPSSLITIPHTLPATKGDDDGGHAPLNRLTAPRRSQWLGIKCAPPAINNLLASDLFPSVSETLRRHPPPIAYKIALLPSFSLPMPISVPIYPISSSRSHTKAAMTVHYNYICTCSCGGGNGREYKQQHVVSPELGRENMFFFFFGTLNPPTRERTYRKSPGVKQKRGRFFLSIDR